MNAVRSVPFGRQRLMSSTPQIQSSSVLLVLGLPQAGSARVARMLEQCGAPEHTAELAQQQHQLLQELGSGWDSPLNLPDRCFSSTSALAFEQAIEQALAQEQGLRLSQACLPGLERVLPIWHRALAAKGSQPRHVLVLRHPLEVAEQFRASHGWSRDHGLLVWLQSSLAMERHSRHHQRVVLDLEQVRWDVDGALNRLEGRLQLALPERHHRSLLELEGADQPEPAPASVGLPVHGDADTSPLLQMALRLHGWLLAEAQQAERESHLPAAIQQQLQMAETLMGRTLSEVSARSENLNQAMDALQRRRLVRLSEWLRGRKKRAA
jgi:hypothetical protein